MIDLRGDRSEKVQYDDIELIAVLSGEMKYNVNGEIVNIPSGGGIFVNARQMHFGFSDTKSECSFLCVFLHPMLLCSVSAYENEFIMPVVRNTAMSYAALNRGLA